MLNKIISGFEWVRKRLCPQRIYKYGKVGLFIDDDRFLIEKVFDYIGDYLCKLQNQYSYRLKGDGGFRPYFDWSLGFWINNRGAIKDIERSTGLDYVSVKDWEKESKRQRRNMDSKFEDKLEGRLKDVVKDINQGRSFVKENAEHRRKIYQQYGRNH
jgi:hypothetical protein